MSKVLTTPPPAPGGNAVFTLTVTNNGPSTATGVVVTDTLPAGLTYVSNSCGATFADPTLTWNVGTLAVSASASCTLTVAVNSTSTNTASATGNESDPTPGNNSSSAIVGGVSILAVPTLGGVGLAALILLLGLAGAFMVFRRR
jgi:uncharacterized repeat protein (TIGR01451 family)